MCVCVVCVCVCVCARLRHAARAAFLLTLLVGGLQKVHLKMVAVSELLYEA